MSSSEPKLRFDPSMSQDGFADWQTEVREKLHELMCFPDPVPQPDPVLLSSKSRDGYRIEKWEAYPEPGSVVPYLVLIPDGVSASCPAPAVMCFTGSAHSKELLAGEPELNPDQPENRHPVRNQMARHCVKAGLVAIAVENPGTCEVDELPADGMHPNSGRDKLCAELMMFGRNYVGLSVHQKSRILEWLRTRDYVTAGRIALSGHSLGTEPAMAMAVLDTSIHALVFNDFLCDNRERYVTRAKPDEAWSHINPLWHVIPGLLAWLDFPDLLASLAPRPLLITEGGPTHHLERVARAYELVGARARYAYHYYPKYSRPEDRRHDFETIPEGIPEEEWFEYANLDVPDHCFKENLAVPWLLEQMAD